MPPVISHLKFCALCCPWCQRPTSCHWKWSELPSMSNTPKLSQFVWGSLQLDSIRMVSIRTTGSQDPWNNDTWTFLILKTWQQTSLDLYEALYDLTQFARRRVSCKSTSGMMNRQQGKGFVPIRSNWVKSTTFSTHPQGPDQLYCLSLVQIDFWHVESTEGEMIRVVCYHVLRTSRVHVPLFHGSWLQVVWIDTVRIKLNRKVAAWPFPIEITWL